MGQKVPFSIATGNEELMHVCCPKHLRMGAARMMEDKEREEEGRRQKKNMKRNKIGTK